MNRSSDLDTSTFKNCMCSTACTMASVQKNAIMLESNIQRRCRPPLPEGQVRTQQRKPYRSAQKYRDLMGSVQYRKNVFTSRQRDGQNRRVENMCESLHVPRDFSFFLCQLLKRLHLCPVAVAECGPRSVTSAPLSSFQ